MSSDQDTQIAALKKERDQWRYKYKESVRLGGVTCWTCDGCGKTRSGSGCLVCAEAERDALRAQVDRDRHYKKDLAAVRGLIEAAAKGVGVDWHVHQDESVVTMKVVIESLRMQVDALDAFKTFVHKRLDVMGVPAYPDGPHSKEGCRIGDRLDLIVKERESLRKALRDCAAAVGATVGTECSTEFHCFVAEEVRLVVDKLKKHGGPTP